MAGGGADEGAALILRGATPDARLLIRGQGELEAVTLGFALVADALGRLDLVDGEAGAPDREEELGARVPAGGLVAASWLRDASASARRAASVYNRLTDRPEIV